MDVFSSKTPDSFFLIRTLFYIMVLVTVTTVVLFFALDMHQSVKVESGEIISENTPIEYLAPFEAEVARVLIMEGDEVRKGDTLVVLYNENLQADYEKKEKELSLAKQNIAILQQQLDNHQRKVEFQKEEAGRLRASLSSQEKGNSYQMAALEEQVNTLKRKLDIAEKRIRKDLQLYQNGAISEVEYSEKYKAYLDESNRYAELKKDFLQQRLNSNNLDNLHSSQINRNKQGILNGEAEYLSLQKELQKAEASKLQLDRTLLSSKSELAKQYIIAGIDGVISKLYKAQKQVNYFSKGQSILVLRPTKEETFYARLNIAQEAVKDIQMNLPAHIEVKAYSHYQYGILKGKVVHLDKGEQNKFYVLADIPKEQTEAFQLRSGYEVKGRIIVKKMKLYQFVFSKIFKKIEL